MAEKKKKLTDGLDSAIDSYSKFAVKSNKIEKETKGRVRGSMEKKATLSRKEANIANTKRQYEKKIDSLKKKLDIAEKAGLSSDKKQEYKDELYLYKKELSKLSR
jgi:LPS O-antigen subunit length determinant protein (WzzB/FepE family)